MIAQTMTHNLTVQKPGKMAPTFWHGDNSLWIKAVNKLEFILQYFVQQSQSRVEENYFAFACSLLWCSNKTEEGGIKMLSKINIIYS